MMLKPKQFPTFTNTCPGAESPRQVFFYSSHPEPSGSLFLLITWPIENLKTNHVPWPVSDSSSRHHIGKLSLRGAFKMENSNRKERLFV